MYGAVRYGAVQLSPVLHMCWKRRQTAEVTARSRPCQAGHLHLHLHFHFHLHFYFRFHTTSPHLTSAFTERRGILSPHLAHLISPRSIPHHRPQRSPSLTPHAATTPRQSMTAIDFGVGFVPVIRAALPELLNST